MPTHFALCSQDIRPARSQYLLTYSIRILSSIVKLPHRALADRQLPITPKAHALAKQHAQLLILQRAHPAPTERPMPILAAHRRLLGRRPLALKAAHEETRCDNAMARDMRREWVVAQRAADGAR